MWDYEADKIAKTRRCKQIKSTYIMRKEQIKKRFEDIMKYQNANYGSNVDPAHYGDPADDITDTGMTGKDC